MVASDIRSGLSSAFEAVIDFCPTHTHNVGMAEFLGTFEQAVLLAIMRLRGDAYGRMILHVVMNSLKRTVSAGAVYTTLDRLESRGLVHSRVDEGTPARGGRPRRYYSVAAAGARALNESHKTLSEMWSGVQWPVEVKR